MHKQCLYLIDATAFCYRAFYAVGELSTSFGQPTNAVYGFVNMLNKIIKNKNPQYLAVCFDVSRDTFRQKKFAEYKIQRPPMPDKLSSQMPFIKEIIRAYGITIFEKEGFEADDVIATLTKKAREKGLEVMIISSDKDILQLVDTHTQVFSPYKDEGTLYDEKKVEERFGVKPQQIPDLISLMGDASDNIPNVPGIGETTASKLIQNFHSLDKLLGSLDALKQQNLRDALKGSLNTIRLNKELVVLNEKVDIDFSPEELKLGAPDYTELFKLFKRLEFKKLLKGLPLPEERTEELAIEKIKDAQLREVISPGCELFLSARGVEDMLFLARDRFFKLDSIGENTISILEDRQIKKISHDLKGIKLALADARINLQGLFFDTMIAAYLLNPSQPEYGLADIAYDYLGKAVSKNMPQAEALNLIRQLREKLGKELEDKGLTRLFYDLEMPLVGVLASMEATGIKLDLEFLKGLSRELEKKLAKLIQDIYALSGCQFNINSPKQLREVLFEKLKLPVVKKTKTGASTDEEVLKELAKKHALAALLLDYRQLMKIKTTYVDTLPELTDKKAGRIHTSFNQTATETGRLSSSNPNLQNLPIKTEVGKKIRQAVIASGKENLLLSCDYSQIELRILAHLSGDENLITAFREKKDVHRISAALIYGLQEKDVDDMMRETAKRVNFGIVYGLTSFGLSRDLGIPIDAAQNFIDAYFVRYPRVKDYIQEAISQAEKNGFVTTLLGRRRYIPEIKSGNQGIRQFAQRKAINTPIQGTASDLIKLAMIHIDREIKEEALNSKMILQIHDELLFDAPRQELERLSALVRERMENVLKLAVPIRVEIKKGRNWLEMEAI